MSASYGWWITRDLLAEDFDGKSEVGVSGPSTISPETEERLKAGEGEKFRMLDDDGNVYYEGLFLDELLVSDFGPLDDFGTPNAGCTEIQYFSNGAWETL